MRVLRPLTTDTYIVMTMWQNEFEVDEWKNRICFITLTLAKAYFQERPIYLPSTSMMKKLRFPKTDTEAAYC
ncbi:hypothetical protein ACI2OX_15275 [Bacillus sp. N9]